MDYINIENFGMCEVVWLPPYVVNLNDLLECAARNEQFKSLPSAELQRVCDYINQWPDWTAKELVE